MEEGSEESSVGTGVRQGTVRSGNVNDYGDGLRGRGSVGVPFLRKWMKSKTSL